VTNFKLQARIEDRRDALCSEGISFVSIVIQFVQRCLASLPICVIMILTPRRKLLLLFTQSVGDLPVRWQLLAQRRVALPRNILCRLAENCKNGVQLFQPRPIKVVKHEVKIEKLMKSRGPQSTRTALFAVATGSGNDVF
jgi:hypothetical protein